MQKTIFLPGTSTAVRSPTHIIAPHLGLDLYPVAEFSCFHQQGVSRLEVSHSTVQVAKGIFPKGMTRGANRQVVTSSAGVTQPTGAGASAAPTSQPHTAVQTPCQWLLKGRWQTSYQCKPLSYWGGSATTALELELIIPLRQQLLQMMQQDQPEVNQDNKLTSTIKSVQVCSQRRTRNPMKTRDYGLWSHF